MHIFWELSSSFIFMLSSDGELHPFPRWRGFCQTIEPCVGVSDLVRAQCTACDRMVG